MHGHNISIIPGDKYSIGLEGLITPLNNSLRNNIQFEILGSTAKGSELVELYKQNIPDLVITEIVLFGKSGFDVIKELRTMSQKVSVIFYTYLNNIYIIYKSYQLGACAYINKNSEVTALTEAILHVLQNKRAFPDLSIYQKVLPKHDFFTGLEFWEIKQILTDRELAVFKQFGQGLSINEIAESLFLCRKSIEYHQENTKYKLKLNTKNELIKIASRFNLFVLNEV